MADSQTIYINGIGPILLERSTRAKRIIISVRPTKGVRVAVPTHTSFKQTLDFINRQKQWIIRTTDKVKKLERQQKALAYSFSAIDKAKAGKTLIDRLRQLARKYGFAYNKVTIRNQKTRWGSCSVKGNISLNMKLTLLPEELVDYVILHELVHTKIHNHSKKFWTELDKYVGDGKAYSHRLRKNKVRLQLQ
jgi:predicted metal-dependent hydrolase